MTSFQLLVGALICFFMVLRPFFYKPCVQYFPAELSVAFTATWLMLGLAITFPFFSEPLIEKIPNMFFAPYFWISVAKGVLLWWMIKLQQIINKDSTSTSVFFGFIALALSSLCNNLFFHEGLKLFQILCICGFGVLGLSFVIMGDAKRLSAKGKLAFAIIVIFGAFFSVSDHLVIPQIGWYAHLFISSLAMFIACLLHGIGKDDFINMFKNKTMASAGLIYVVSEFLIIFASINILPVSFVAMFMRLAAPIVMIISAHKYKEQTIRNQLIFGGIAFLLALPLIFFK